MDTLENIGLYHILMIITVVLIGIAIIFFFKRKGEGFFTDIGDGEPISDEVIFNTIEKAGYIYDSHKDLFYTSIDAWQRNMGYCRLYDEAAAPLSIIIDCEPIYFEYAGMRWMIELWKGQYGMTTGCEIGIYYTDGPDLNIPGVFNGTFYKCAENEYLLNMETTLIKQGEILFNRKDKHWWLTGFILGEFSEPWDLKMDATIQFKDKEMTNAFIEGLERVGYTRNKDYDVEKNEVNILYNKPFSKQPFSRKPETDWLSQRKNELLCIKYLDITKDIDYFPDRIRAIQREAPELMGNILNFGKNKNIYQAYDLIKNYLRSMYRGD